MSAGTPADVAAELRLHGLRAEATERGVVLRGTLIGDVEAWVRPDEGHFFEPLGYPGELVPVVDADLWREASQHPPRLLLVVSTVTRATLVCSPRKTAALWVSRRLTGPRGFMATWTCPRGHLKSFAALKDWLL